MEIPRTKFVFNCQRCGRCCEQKEDLPIYLEDIERWSKDGTVYRAFPNLSVSDNLGVLSIQLERENGKCKMYDADKKMCLIYDCRPLICRSYPLQYNGKGFLIRDEKCPGLNKGEMTKENLEDIRNAAKKEQGEGERILMIFPIIQSILLKDIAKKSEAEYNKLTQEEKEKIDGILKRTRT